MCMSLYQEHAYSYVRLYTRFQWPDDEPSLMQMLVEQMRRNARESHLGVNCVLRITKATTPRAAATLKWIVAATSRLHVLHWIGGKAKPGEATLYKPNRDQELVFDFV